MKPRPSLPPAFLAKKSQILTAISSPSDDYTDNSPKGTIDTAILALINQINAIDGLVTTSSCSGRVAVFVEGPKPHPSSWSDSRDDDKDEPKDSSRDEPEDALPASGPSKTSGGPAGKGGGRWLFVSHDPVAHPASPPADHWTSLCGLTTTPSPQRSDLYPLAPHGQLIKLIFSPVILHVLCATLQHAKTLLAAAINAGFRESGVQSLRALDEDGAGVGTMVGIRSNGLGFESVVGVVDGWGGCRALVDEGYLRAMFGVVEERFEWNAVRRERLRGEIERGFGGGLGGWEDKETRRVRKMEEGLRRQREMACGSRDGKKVDGATEGEVTADVNVGSEEALAEGGLDMFDDEH